MNKKAELLKLSEIPGIIKNHPLGLLVGIILFALIIMYQGLIGCIFKLFIRLPFNLTTPEKILADGICDPNKMLKVRFAEWLLNLFQYEWFIWTILIIGFSIFLYFKFKD